MSSIKNRLVWRYCLIIFLSVTVLEILFMLAVKQYYYGSIEQVLTTKATVGAAFYDRYIEGGNLRDRAQRILENVADSELARIEILDRSGWIVIDSDGFSPHVKIDTADVNAAFQDNLESWIGKTGKPAEKVLAVTAPLKSGERIIGGLRYITSLENTDRVLKDIFYTAVGVGLLVMFAAFLLSMILARSIIVPIRELTKTAELMAVGDYSRQAVKHENDEIGRLADTLNLMAREITQSEKVKQDFLSSISHELRTPLTSIKGWSETILSEEEDSKEETELGLKIISKEVDRLIGLVEDLLDFSRFQSGRIEVDLQPISINRIVEEVSLQFEIRTREKLMQLMIDCRAEPDMIQGDSDRLKQVLIILIDNALKFTPEQGAVTIKTALIDGRLLITVQDTGEGIRAEHLAKVKEKFYKGDSKLPGSGLGLAIAGEIIRLHRGELNIYSMPAMGTEVEVILPIM